MGASRAPEARRTRHLPHTPLPEQGASMATLAFRATSRSFSPGLASMDTLSPLSKRKVMVNIGGSFPDQDFGSAPPSIAKPDRLVKDLSISPRTAGCRRANAGTTVSGGPCGRFSGHGGSGGPPYFANAGAFTSFPAKVLGPGLEREK